jgi:hypothetical protein
VSRRYVAVGTALTALVTAGVIMSDHGSLIAPLTEPEIQAFEADVVALGRALGGVIEVGVAGAGSMKHAIGRIDRDELSGAELEREAGAWMTALSPMRRVVDELRPPPGLEGAKVALAEAVDTYVSVATVLREASQASGERLDRALDRAVELGSRGDALFDDAAELIQAARRAAGLGPTIDLPDPGNSRIAHTAGGLA